MSPENQKTRGAGKTRQRCSMPLATFGTASHFPIPAKPIVLPRKMFYWNNQSFHRSPVRQIFCSRTMKPSPISTPALQSEKPTTSSKVSPPNDGATEKNQVPDINHEEESQTMQGTMQLGFRRRQYVVLILGTAAAAILGLSLVSWLGEDDKTNKPEKNGVRKVLVTPDMLKLPGQAPTSVNRVGREALPLGTPEGVPGGAGILNIPPPTNPTDLPGGLPGTGAGRTRF